MDSRLIEGDRRRSVALCLTAEQAVFSQQQQQVIRCPFGLLREKANLRKISYPSGIHKEPD